MVEVNSDKKNQWRRILQYRFVRFRRFGSLQRDHDPEQTINRIKGGIEFSGSNMWILAFAIIIASIGLNVNSTAVIIGAMLISPLMGPIMGIGLSVGIVDTDMLNRSLRNFGAMTIISLIASTLYFFISPLSDAQSELLARIHPTIYDVLIAFFGGLTGMVANSRKDEKITIISGVAIATALMPPLCTAGYGLATLQLKFFFGAAYLYFINTFFIALATALLALYLKIPKRSFLDPQRERKMKSMIYVFAALVCIPSVFMAFTAVKESRFNSNVIRYVDNIEKNPLMGNAKILNTSRHFSRQGSTIDLTIIGQSLSDEQIEQLRTQLPEFGLSKTTLTIHQPFSSDVHLKGEFMEDLYNRNLELTKEIENYKLTIAELNGETIDNKQIAKELAVQFDNLESFSIVKAVYINVKTLSADTVPTVYAVWKNTPMTTDTKKMVEILKVRLNLPTLTIINKQKKE